MAGDTTRQAVLTQMASGRGWLARLRPHLLPITGLLLLTALVYGRALGHEFLSNWDDDRYVVHNLLVHEVSWEHLQQIFGAVYFGNYAPLHLLSYQVDYLIWGLRPAGFILDNLLLHAANGLLCYVLLFSLSGRRDWSGLAAGLFLLHPVQVESVVWISQRKNLLAMTFCLLALLAYCRYRFGTAWRWGWYAATLALFFLALLAKSVAVVLPAVLLCLDAGYATAAQRRHWLLDKLPFLALAAMFALLALYSQQPEFDGGRSGYPGGSLWTTLLTMLPVFVRYLGLLAWPTELSAVYTPPVRTSIDLAVLGAAGLLAGYLVLLISLWRRRRDLAAWLTVFAIGLLPVSQVVPLVTLMNDRYLYFPLLGLAACAAGVLVWLGDQGGWCRRAAVAICLAACLFPWLAWQRVPVWHDSVSLWRDVTAKLPRSREAWNGLGEAHMQQGRLAAAGEVFRYALSIPGGFADPEAERNLLLNLALVYLRQGQAAEARPVLERRVQKFPAFAEGWLVLGDCRVLQDDLAGATEAYRRALQLQPDSRLARQGVELAVAAGSDPAAAGQLSRQEGGRYGSEQRR